MLAPKGTRRFRSAMARMLCACLLLAASSPVVSKSASAAGPAQAATVTVYPRISHPGFFYTETDYRVTVNARSVPVRDYKPFGDIVPDRDYYYAHFGISGGAVNIEVDAHEPITTFAISPKAYGLKGSVNGSKLSLILDQSRYLAIRINDKRTLYVLADANETERPAATGIDAATGKPVFNIKDAAYRADNSGAQLVTTALQKALDDAAAAPRGGIVYVPAGLYAINTLRMKSFVWLYLEPGAVLMANPDRATWGKGQRPPVLVNCTRTEGNKIYGRGLLYCQGVALAKQQMEGFGQLRIRPVQIQHAKNFTLDGITAHESTAWTIPLEGGSGMTVSNVKVLNEKRTGTNDGINVCGGSNITVKHCFVATMDDAVCVKGLFYGDVHDVRIDDIVTDNRIVGIKIGMQGITPIYNVHVSNFHVITCHKGIDLMHYYGSKDYHDILFEDVTIEKVMGGPPLRMIIRQEEKPMYPIGVGSIYNIECRRITIEEPAGGPLLEGYDATNSVRNVTLSDIYLQGRLVNGPGDGVRVGKFAYNVMIQGKLEPSSLRALPQTALPAR